MPRASLGAKLIVTQTRMAHFPTGPKWMRCGGQQSQRELALLSTPTLMANLVRLAAATMSYHDVPPVADQATALRSNLDRLISILAGELDPEQARGVPSVVNQITVE